MAALPHESWRASPRLDVRIKPLQHFHQQPETSEDEDRLQYNSKTAGYGTDRICGSHRLRNQIEQKKPTTKKTMNRLTHVMSDCLFSALHRRLFEHSSQGRSLDALRPLTHVTVAQTGFLLGG